VAPARAKAHSPKIPKGTLIAATTSTTRVGPRDTAARLMLQLPPGRRLPGWLVYRRMPDIELFNPPALAPPVGFAHAAAAGDLVVLGGQTGTDASGRIVAPGDLVAQFAQAIRNVAAALEAAGSRPERALKLTYFVTDVGAYRAALRPIGAAYRAVFGRHYPASSLFEVRSLFDPDAMIEIDCIALR
jgi:enamine deaminase RidA (YjgF/YER057c/UK114 family)